MDGTLSCPKNTHAVFHCLQKGSPYLLAALSGLYKAPCRCQVGNVVFRQAGSKPAAKARSWISRAAKGTQVLQVIIKIRGQWHMAKVHIWNQDKWGPEKLWPVLRKIPFGVIGGSSWTSGDINHSSPPDSVNLDTYIGPWFPDISDTRGKTTLLGWPLQSSKMVANEKAQAKCLY